MARHQTLLRRAGWAKANREPDQLEGDAEAEADDVPYLVLVDAYLAAVKDERLAGNGDREAARLRVRAALDRVMEQGGVRCSFFREGPANGS